MRTMTPRWRMRISTKSAPRHCLGRQARSSEGCIPSFELARTAFSLAARRTIPRRSLGAAARLVASVSPGCRLLARSAALSMQLDWKSRTDQGGDRAVPSNHAQRCGTACDENAVVVGWCRLLLRSACRSGYGHFVSTAPEEIRSGAAIGERASFTIFPAQRESIRVRLDKSALRPRSRIFYST